MSIEEGIQLEKRFFMRFLKEKNARNYYFNELKRKNDALLYIRGYNAKPSEDLDRILRKHFHSCQRIIDVSLTWDMTKQGFSFYSRLNGEYSCIHGDGPLILRNIKNNGYSN